MESPTQKPNIVFFGSRAFSLTAIKVLHARHTTPTAVVTYKGSPVEKWSLERNIRTFTPTDLNEQTCITSLQEISADFFVVAGFSKLPREIFSLPRYTTLNIHPSLLPAFRGQHPEVAQVLTHAKPLGVTIHIIDEYLDTGPIVAQQEYTPPIWPMRATRLSFELSHLGANLLLNTISQWTDELSSGHEQTAAHATYSSAILSQESYELTPDQDHFLLWTKFCALGWDQQLYLLLHQSDTNIKVFILGAYFRNGYFVIRTVQVAGEPMIYEQFLAAYQLLNQTSWTQFSIQHNTEITKSSIDSRAPDPTIRLREAIHQHVLVLASDRTIINLDGTLSNDWLFDFRNIFLDSTSLETIADIFWSRYESAYPFQVGGQETAAIPLVTAIILRGAQRGTPVNGFFIRKERKQTGLQKIVEGRLTDKKIILVDDLVNSGATQQQQVSILQELGNTVSDIFTLVRFREHRHYRFASEDSIAMYSIFTPADFGLSIGPPQSHAPQEANFTTEWKFTANDPNFFYVVPKSRPILDANTLYFGSDNGTFWALDQNTGAVVWRHKIWRKAVGKAIFSSPTLHNQTVIYGAYDGNVYALHTTDGTKKWTFIEADWVGSSPCIAAKLDLVFIGLEFGLFKKTGGIVALEFETGHKKWEFRMNGLTHASPAYASKYNVVGIGCNNHTFYLLDAKKGTERWQFTTAGAIKYAAAFDTENNRVLFGSFDGKLYACDITSGAKVAHFNTRGEIYSTPLIFADKIFIASMDKCLYCLDRKTLEELWHFETAGKILCSPVVIQDRVYIGSNDGFLYELDLYGKPTGFFPTTERIVNNIVYNETSDSYYLSTFANEIYKLRRTN